MRLHLLQLDFIKSTTQVLPRDVEPLNVIAMQSQQPQRATLRDLPKHGLGGNSGPRGLTSPIHPTGPDGTPTRPSPEPPAMMSSGELVAAGESLRRENVGEHLLD